MFKLLKSDSHYGHLTKIFFRVSSTRGYIPSYKCQATNENLAITEKTLDENDEK